MTTIYAKTNRNIQCTANVTGITNFSGYTAHLTVVSINNRNLKVITKTSTVWDSNVVVFALTQADTNLEYVDHEMEFAISNLTEKHVIAREHIEVKKSYTFS